MKTKYIIISKDVDESIGFSKILQKKGCQIENIFCDCCYSKIQNDIENLGNGFNEIFIFDLDKKKKIKICN